MVRKIPKYRAYKNVAEFLNVYDIGDVITIRGKYHDESVEIMVEIMRAQVAGITGDNIIFWMQQCTLVGENIFIGRRQYNLQELFENYEVEHEGKWYPIGVEE